MYCVFPGGFVCNVAHIWVLGDESSACDSVQNIPQETKRCLVKFLFRFNYLMSQVVIYT